MTVSELPAGESGVLKALHRDTDERQWQRILAFALREDLGNARAFAEAALRSASQDPTGHRRAEGMLERLPNAIRVFDEQHLHSTTRRRSPLVGIVDVVLRSGGRDDWAVAVELKLTAGYGTQQLARYLEYGAPLLAIVGDRSDSAGQEVSAHDRWLGEAVWCDLRPALCSFTWPRGGGAMWLALLDRMQAVWADPPSYAKELDRERDLVTRLKGPLWDRTRALVAEQVSPVRAELVEVSEIGEEEGVDGFVLVLTSGSWDEATEALFVSPLFEGSHLRAVDIEWVDPAARTSRSRSLGQLHRSGLEILGGDIARTRITIAPGEIEATDPVTATLDAVEPVLERIIAQAWRRRNAPVRRRRRRR
ncbi:MAG: hypothetical protein MSC31_13915 [Solirubrobacteraceae bacterium MAG38_C4-C5]|nr:hypothetical protein [Candidatus Siliceabacter maunaloa]